MVNDGGLFCHTLDYFQTVCLSTVMFFAVLGRHTSGFTGVIFDVNCERFIANSFFLCSTKYTVSSLANAPYHFCTILVSAPGARVSEDTVLHVYDFSCPVTHYQKKMICLGKFIH